MQSVIVQCARIPKIPTLCSLLALCICRLHLKNLPRSTKIDIAVLTKLALLLILFPCLQLMAMMGLQDLTKWEYLWYLIQNCIKCEVYFYSPFATLNSLYGIDFQLYTCFGPSLGLVSRASPLPRGSGLARETRYSFTSYESFRGPFRRMQAVLFASISRSLPDDGNS